METETVVMSNRRRMVLKPLSPTITSQIKEQNYSNTSNGFIPVSNFVNYLLKFNIHTILISFTIPNLPSLFIVHLISVYN